MGRKNAKTATSAFLLLLHLVGPEAKANSQLYSAAQSREQASLLFSLAAKIVRMSPDLSQYVGIRDTNKQLYCQELGTLYRALSAEASTAYGLSPVFTVHDELGQVKGPRSELYDALETASAAHKEPLSIIISTQAPTDGDLLSILIDDAVKGQDEEVKVSLYTCPIEDEAFSEESIRKANPHFDYFMNQKEVLSTMREAERMPSKEATYRNLILNQRVESNQPFVPLSVWEANGDPIEEFKDSPVYCGLDLSSTSDLTAFVMCSFTNGKWNILPICWLPNEGLYDKAKNDKVPYDVWHDQGYLETTPGSSIQYEYIAMYLKEVFDKYNIIKIGFDRWAFKFLKPWLIKADLSEEDIEKFEEFGQGTKSMSPALRELESLLLNNKFRHGKHPVLTMCALNSRVEINDAGDRKFTKKKSSGRIDAMVALAMAVGVMPEENEEMIQGEVIFI